MKTNKKRWQPGILSIRLNNALKTLNINQLLLKTVTIIITIIIY